MTVLGTRRLQLRHLEARDAVFIKELLNETLFLRYVGDKGIRTVSDACTYIESGPAASYRRYGFGLYCITLKNDETPIGICGLLKRDSLPDVDLGFALLKGYRRRGFAAEAARAVLKEASVKWGLERILAITHPDNSASIRTLCGLGFTATPDKVAVNGGEAVCLFGKTL